MDILRIKNLNSKLPLMKNKKSLGFQHLSRIITGRNEVVAKVMFLQVSVILLTGGGRVSASVHAGMPYPPLDGEPPRMRTTPPDANHHPPPDGEPPPIRPFFGIILSYAYRLTKQFEPFNIGCKCNLTKM